MVSEHHDYVRGTMPIETQIKTFSGFKSKSAFVTAFLIVTILMPVLVLAAGIPWFLSLVMTFIVGVLLAPAFKLGHPWYATLVGLSILAIGVCLFCAIIA